MKLTIFLLLLTAILALKTHHEKQKNIKDHNQGESALRTHHNGVSTLKNSFLESHAQADAVSAAADVISAATNLATFMLPFFQVTCSDSGYKRGNNINIYNDMSSQSMKFLGTYQDSGKIYSHGNYTINSEQNTTWNLVKTAGSATGSNGVMVWGLQNGYLVIFYQNPWSAYNFAGICYRSSVSTSNGKVEQATLESIYDKLYSDHPDWDQNCILTDNYYTESLPFWQSKSLKAGGYDFGLFTKYELTDYSGTDDCYIQELDIVVRKA